MRREEAQFAFQLFRWVPDVVRAEFVTVGVLLRDLSAGGRTVVQFTEDWSRVRAMGGAQDVALLRELAEELAQRLVVVEQDDDRRALLAVACSSFSTGLQVTEEKRCLGGEMRTELRRLMRMYVDGRAVERMERRAEATGRAGLVRSMRREFEQAGIWTMMRRNIAAAEYNGHGDRLRIDCGYRVESAGAEGSAVRLIQAVSLQHDARFARALAFSAPRLREGVRRREGAALRLTAVVEAREEVESTGGWSFAVDALRELAIDVTTTGQLAELAMLARQELRM